MSETETIKESESVTEKKNLAAEAFRSGEYERAKGLYLEMIEAYGPKAEIYCNLGVVYRALGEQKMALESYLEARKLDPKYAINYLNLGNVLKDMKDYRGAIEAYSACIRLNPKDFNAYNSLGIVYELAGDNKKAIAAYKEAVRANPKFAKAINNIGVVLYKQQEYEKSEAIFKIALEVDPEYYEVYSNMGATQNKLKKYDEAVQSLSKAIEKRPGHSGAYTNLGNVYNKLHEYKKAEEMHAKSIKLDPNGANAHSNIATSYKYLGKHAKALESYKQAITLKPDFENAHFDLSTLLLAREAFEEGFKEYEWRFKKEEMRSHILRHRTVFQQTMLRPEHLRKPEILQGKRLLLHSEQGYGDSIMFARFAERFNALGMRVMFECRDALKPLFEPMEALELVVGRDEKNTPEFDFHLPIMSAAYVLGVRTKEDFPSAPYLSAPQEPALKIEKEKGIVDIGICWSASATGESYDGKVFELERFDKLIKHPKFRIHSLQVGHGSEQIEAYGYQDKMIDYQEQLSDFSKTASLIDQLDLVISSDTSVAHLCGAMGAKGWVLLQKYPDWRWLFKGVNSYLYPSLKLLRQKQDRNWEGVFQSMMARLEKEYKVKF